MDRDFFDPQAESGCPHLHFEIPAIGRLHHTKRLEPVAADRAKRSHVRVTNPVSGTHQDAHQAPREDLGGSHAAGLSLTREPGGETKIRISADHRPDNRWSRGWIVRAVSVDEAEDLRVCPRGQDSGGARPPIAAARLDDHARARAGGDLGRPVARTPVDDQNLVDAEREKLPRQRADRPRLVEAGGDDADKGLMLADAHGRQRLQRKPQLRQLCGGRSVCSISRKA
jgi:hypothetical protein